MRVLLVWPRYKAKTKKEGPPLGLLKIAGWHRAHGDEVHLVRAVTPVLRDWQPDRVYVTSMFTYTRDPVVRQVHAAWRLWPGVDVRLGGVWASLLPDEARYIAGLEPHVGLWDEVEDVRPAWDLWEADYSVAFASRGCIRSCRWCSVPKLDGPEFRAKPVDLVLANLDLERPVVELWDNNMLAHPQFEELAERLLALDKRVVIRQGLDCRLLTRDQAVLVRRLRGRGDVYMGYDQPGQGEAVERAIHYLAEAGQPKAHILVFVLYNFYDPVSGRGDVPEEIYQRIDEIVGWGARAYPCRYRPVHLSESLWISPKWGWDALRVFNEARGNMSMGRGTLYKSLREYVDAPTKEA